MLPEEIEVRDEDGKLEGVVDLVGDMHAAQEKVEIDPADGSARKVIIIEE